MSKSLGNFITVHDLLQKGLRGEVIRLALMSTKYNEPMDWSEKLVSDAQKTLDRWYRLLPSGYGSHAVIETNLPKEFVDALGDDLNVPKAISLMHEAQGEQLAAMGQLLGIFTSSAEQWFKYSPGSESLDEDTIGEQIGERIAAKKARDFAKADAIRKSLLDQGIILEDRPDGTTDWRRA